MENHGKTAAAAKSLQSCPTLCDPINSSLPGSAVPGILQPRTLDWVAISFSNAWKWKGKVKSLSRVRLLATPWTAAYQAPPCMGFSRQEYWSGVPLPSLTDQSSQEHLAKPNQSFSGTGSMVRSTGSVHGLMYLWGSIWDWDCSRGKKSLTLRKGKRFIFLLLSYLRTSFILC